jgi:hypothetical protein
VKQKYQLLTEYISIGTFDGWLSSSCSMIRHSKQHSVNAAVKALVPPIPCLVDLHCPICRFADLGDCL